MVNLVPVVTLLLQLLMLPLVTAIESVTSPYGNRTLVLYDERVQANFESQFSTFLDLIEANGAQSRILPIDGKSSLSLFDANHDKIYENVVIFPSKARTLSHGTTFHDLVAFAEQGGNLLLISSSEGTQIDVTAFLNQLGIYPSPRSYKFIDYHADTDTVDEHSVVQSVKPEFLNSLVVPHTSDKLAYKDGSVAILDNNKYLIPLLAASESSVTYDLDKGYLSDDSTWHSGSQGFLAAAYEARNNARVAWVGSESFFDNSADQSIEDDLIKWVFQINGVIKPTYFHHSLVDKDGHALPQVEYKIKDFCKFEVGISEWDGAQWGPYKAEDVQLEFIMLDPYYRITLPFEQVKNGSAIYGTVFQIPDQHGMFTFKVDYKRSGLSFIDESVVVPVRHLANDEYPRSWEITNSWVYVASFVAVVSAWLLFVFFYIYSAEKPITTDEKKTN